MRKRYSNHFRGLFGTRFPFITEGAYPVQLLSQHDSVQNSGDVIRHLAEKQSCLFVKMYRLIWKGPSQMCQRLCVSLTEAHVERLMKLPTSARKMQDRWKKRTRNVLPTTTTTATRHGEPPLPIIYDRFFCIRYWWHRGVHQEFCQTETSSIREDKNIKKRGCSTELSSLYFLYENQLFGIWLL